MKILMIADFYHESQLYQENLLVKYYNKLGISVTVIASKYTSVIDYCNERNVSKEKPQVYFFEKTKIIRLNYKVNLLNKVRMLRGLDKHIIQEKPDIIYVHGFPLNLISSIKYKRKKNKEVKVIFDSHSDYYNTANNYLSRKVLHEIFYKYFFKRVIKKIDQFYYITPQSGKFVNEVYKIPYSSMKLLPLGADTDLINQIKSSIDKNTIKESLGIKPNNLIVFTGGKLNPIKRTELVIEAVNSLNKEVLHLIIVGASMDDKYNQKLLKLSEGAPNIHHMGWLDAKSLCTYLCISDVAVYPSSASVLWQQSIAAGLPIIIGENSDKYAEYLNRNNNLFILNKENISADSIAKYVNRLIDDRLLLDKMKENAIKTTNEFLSYDRIAKMSIKLD